MWPYRAELVPLQVQVHQAIVRFGQRVANRRYPLQGDPDLGHAHRGELQAAKGERERNGTLVVNVVLREVDFGDDAVLVGFDRFGQSMPKVRFGADIDQHQLLDQA